MTAPLDRLRNRDEARGIGIAGGAASHDDFEPGGMMPNGKVGAGRCARISGIFLVPAQVTPGDRLP